MATDLESIQGAVVLHQEVFLFTDREVVTKLTEKVSQVHRLHCYKGSVFNMTISSPLCQNLRESSIHSRSISHSIRS